MKTLLSATAIFVGKKHDRIQLMTAQCMRCAVKGACFTKRSMYIRSKHF